MIRLRGVGEAVAFVAFKEGVGMLWDAEGHRARAKEYARRAETAESREAREHYRRMERSSLALAKNAEWIRSTNEFLHRWRRE